MSLPCGAIWVTKHAALLKKSAQTDECITPLNSINRFILTLFCPICIHPLEPEPVLRICPLPPSLPAGQALPQHRPSHRRSSPPGAGAHPGFAMPGTAAVPARPGTDTDYYRWKWYSSSCSDCTLPGTLRSGCAPTRSTDLRSPAHISVRGFPSSSSGSGYSGENPTISAASTRLWSR